MLFDFGVAKRVCSGWTALLVVGGFGAACVDETVAPTRPPGDYARGELRVLGVAELTFSDIGTPDVSSSLIVAPTMAALEELRARRDRSGEFPDLIARDLTFPDNSGGDGNGTIQLGQRQTNRFEHNGVRYLSTRMSIRNAQADGTAYDTPRNNLTFLAVSTNSAINQTAVSRLKLQDGTPAPPALALQVMPTVRLELDGDSLIVLNPDVLQIMGSAEVTDIAANAPPGVTTVFPYGFVVRRAGDNTTRTLPASPGPDQFDGVVDFAFSIPRQDNPADDPEKLSVFLLAVDDSETRLSQGLREQNPAPLVALRDRATSLNAETVTLLPGGSLPGFSGARTICRVRTAGTGAPTAFLVNVPRSAFQSFTPDPHATGGSASHLSSTISFEATFSAPVEGAGTDNFTVRGLQSGRKFSGQDYTISGTTISTPSGNFFAGEQVEIALTNALACPDPQVAQYYVQAGQATGDFQSDTTYEVGSRALSVAIGDLNNDGSADLVTANEEGNNVSVLLNHDDGTGTFQAQQTYAVGSGNSLPQSVAIGDLNGDGGLDLVTANLASSNVSVLLNHNDGAGTFQPAQTFGAGVAISIAIGDLDGDGSLDAVTANLASSDVSVLLNHGDGTFRPHQTYAVGSGSAPEAVAIGDVNEDGSLDLVVANGQSDDVSVLLNHSNGTGTFQPHQTYAAGDFPNAAAIGDLNGDGSLDLAVANGASGNVSILLNRGDGTGTFQTHETYAAGDFPNSVAIGDLNGDGSLDLVIANDNIGNASVLLNHNDGTGTFEPQQTYAAGAGNSVAIGDLNGNSVLDLAMANDVAPSATVSVILGQAVP